MRYLQVCYSFNFGGGGGQLPYIPPPPPPPQPATFADASVQGAGVAQGKQPQRGFGSTLLTGNSPLPPAQTAGKSLLGQ